MNSVPHSQLSLRRRTMHEAADAGLALWRANAAAAYIPSLLCVGALVLITRVFLSDFPWIAWLIPIFLGPLIDHLVLQALSVRQFNSEAKGLQLFKGFTRTVFLHLPADLLWRRFFWKQLLAMPLRVLEKVRGKTLRARVKTLIRGGGRQVIGQHLLWPIIEAGLLIGEFFFLVSTLALFRPELNSLSWESMQDLFSSVFEPLFLVIYTVQSIFIRSLFSASNFVVYLNARIETEGWDLRFAFDDLYTQRNAARQRKSPKTPTSKLPLVVLTICALSAPAQIVQAQEGGLQLQETTNSSTVPVSNIPMESLEKVLDHKDFGRGEPGWTIELRNKEKPQVDNEFFDSLEPWLALAQEYSALFLRGLIVLVILGLLIIFGLWAWKNRDLFTKRQKTSKLHSFTFAQKERQEASDFLRQANQALQKGDERRALSALRELAPLLLHSHYGIKTPENSTEQDCLRLARSATEMAVDFSSGFAHIMRSWTILAWAHRELEPSAVQDALRWAQRWVSGGHTDAA